MSDRLSYLLTDVTGCLRFIPVRSEQSFLPSYRSYRGFETVPVTNRVQTRIQTPYGNKSSGSALMTGGLPQIQKPRNPGWGFQKNRQNLRVFNFWEPTGTAPAFAEVLGRPLPSSVNLEIIT